MDFPAIQAFLDLEHSETIRVIPVVSRFPNGRITSVRFPEMPSGYGAIDPTTLTEVVARVFDIDFPLFAIDQVSYQGQTLALLYGPDEERLLQLRNEVVVEYDLDYTLFSMENYLPSQVIMKRTIREGASPEEGEGEKVVKDSLFMRPPNYLAQFFHGGFSYIENDRLVIHSTSVTPFIVRAVVAAVVGIKQRKIVVHPTSDRSSGDGPLLLPLLAGVYSGIATWITRQPCRFTYSNREIQRQHDSRSASSVHFYSRFDQNGALLWKDILVEIDGGAYTIFPSELVDRVTLSSLGVDPHHNLSVEVRIIRTSSPPLDLFQEHGSAIGCFGASRHVTSLALSNGQNPLHSLRQRDKLGQGSLIALKESHYLELLTLVGEVSDFHRKYAAYQSRTDRSEEGFTRLLRRGIGCSLGFQGSGYIFPARAPRNYALTARLGVDGILTICCSIVPDSARIVELWKNSAARILQIDPAKIVIAVPTTDTVPNSGISIFSWSTTVVVRLIEQCCSHIQKNRFREPLPIEVRRSYISPRGGQWSGDDFSGRSFLSRSWISTVVEVELEPITLIPQFRGIWMVVSCGKLPSYEGAREMIEEMTYHTIAWCSGPTPPSQRDGVIEQHYSRPMDGQILPLSIQFTKGESGSYAGVAGLPFNSLPAAYLSAVSQALGREVNEIPVKPWKLIKGAWST